MEESAEQSEDLKNLILEIENSDLPTPKKKEMVDEIKITPDNARDQAYKVLSELMTMTMEVADTMRDKLNEGSPFESDAQAFGQAITNCAKMQENMLKPIEARELAKYKADLQQERDDRLHQQKLELQEKKGSGGKLEYTQNNIMIGSREDVMENVGAEFKKLLRGKDLFGGRGDVIDVEG